jgi:hypothetical protein
MDITILANGDLHLKADSDDREYLRDHPDLAEIDALRELTERHWTNGEFEPFDAGEGNPFVGLTSAPCISEEALVQHDNGEREILGRVWWFPAYETVSLVDRLRDEGEVTFTLAPDVAPEATPVTEPRARRRRQP